MTTLTVAATIRVLLCRLTLSAALVITIRKHTEHHLLYITCAAVLGKFSTVLKPSLKNDMFVPSVVCICASCRGTLFCWLPPGHHNQTARGNIYITKFLKYENSYEIAVLYNK